ncbi:MAG: DUF2357 domain-containing protein [Tuberibacillus sp.]
MALRPSGSDKFITNLVVIETSELSLYIKGYPHHDRYDSLRQFRKNATEKNDFMYFKCTGIGLESVEIFDVREGSLVLKNEHPPIFFENGVYEIIVESKKGSKLSFEHEFPGFRRAVSPVGKNGHILSGYLTFTNEVGLSTFTIKEDRKTLLEVTLEIFPTKLDYKEDYQKLLEEVNNEIYNLAFHFLRKTFLGASPKMSSDPSLTEFYRLFKGFFNQFFQALERIERQPHHQLITQYRYVRGDQIKKMDTSLRRRIQKKVDLFEEVSNGIDVFDGEVLPRKGWTVKKDLSYDTLENRFVKWMINRLIYKTRYLYKKLTDTKGPYEIKPDVKLLDIISGMQTKLERQIQKPFWKNTGKLDRTVMSLVLQMKPGYREVFRIYLIVSRGLELHGQFFKMSVKDIATLYEYWTYLKIGQILSQKYIPIDQNIVKVKRDGLYVDLDQTKSAKRVFKHPATGENIILEFQAGAGKLPTVPQKPDILLRIEKKGQPFQYHYIFDAKYRIDFAVPGTHYGSNYHSPGPLEEDINTMHRYKDALVVREGGPYVRHAFGAYVLFPWWDELGYQSHQFYKSIDEVSVGGLPFLPKATVLVEKFIEQLIDKSAEEIQEEGILPQGTIDYWQSSLEEKVLVGNVNGLENYKAHMRYRFYHIPVKQLRRGWQDAKYIALYIGKRVSGRTNAANGITYFGKITAMDFVKRSEIREIPSKREDLYVRFRVDGWHRLDHTIGPIGYGILSYITTTLNMLKFAKDLPELFIKSEEELTLWRMLRRLNQDVSIDLDNRSLDLASRVQTYKLRGLTFTVKETENLLSVLKNGQELKVFELSWLKRQPSSVSQAISDLLLQT